MADESPDGVEAVLAGGDSLVRAPPPAREGKKAGPPVFDDHVQRVFRADAPNRVWLTDITEHRTTTEGKLYCCAIKDVFSNRIVGYSISDRMTAKLAIVVWIEWKYHRQRAQDTLGGLTPIEFEAKLAEPLTLAA